MKRYLTLAGLCVVVLMSWRFPAYAIALAVLLSLLIAVLERRYRGHKHSRPSE